MDQPGSEKHWSIDGIEPTYAVEDPLRPDATVRGWRLGDKFELQENYLPPLVAWCEFVPRRSRSGAPLLAAFHLFPSSLSGGMFCAWRIGDPAEDGRCSLEPVPRAKKGLYFDYSETPGQGDHASSVLTELVDAALLRSDIERLEFERAREADPLIDVMIEISDIATEHLEPGEREAGRAELGELFDGLTREVLQEIAIRLAFDDASSASELYDLRSLLEDADE